MELRPSVVRPRTRGFLYALVGGSLVFGAFCLFDHDAPPPPAPITKVEVAPQAAAAAPIVVPIHVPPPPAPAPAPEPVVEAEPAGPPRAATPMLDARCVDNTALDADICTWDDGFPAISRDGKMIVAKHSIDDGGRGYPGLSIEFVDVATSKTRTVMILSPDEYDPDSDKHRAKVEKRVAKLNRTLAGKYRSLVRLIDNPTSSARVEIGGDYESVRIIDDNEVAIWRAHYSGRAAYPDMKGDPDVGCGFPDVSGIANVAWDEQTRTVVTTVNYTFGGCLCGADSITYVDRVR